MALQPGTQAPDFTLKTKTPDGLADVTLSENFGKSNTVLLFFPAAFTGVCTQEMCSMSEGMSQYQSLDARVLGVSCDSPFAQEAWAKANGITVPLLSDYKRQVVLAYDVVLEDLVGLGPAAQRAVFVIDKAGVIRYSEVTPTPLELPNFDHVRAALASLG